ncbi:WD40 repeat-like protein [Aspergillus heteromorphus CBS 117.55]|uniref:WD40 repeat-like protein n=1 Tax=Aspergillus heteromorphus CBS 117.55 TaxID=1448321 RepID=A0A317WV86_9EURO|nr:WD40 repeat-like protein [Aspergillus heteromorphus CBS 117.55]PWY89731.1 WD40 repeat-like protein [Aspergillus heteromorphus CBS 117.55]
MALEAPEEAHLSCVQSVTISPDGTLAASGSENSAVKMWDIEKRTELCTFAHGSRPVYRVAFSPNSRMLGSISLEGTVKLWDIAKESIIHMLGTPHYDRHVRFDPQYADSPYFHIAFSPDGKMLSSVSPSYGQFRRRPIKLWDTTRGVLLCDLQGHTSDIGPYGESDIIRSVALSNYLLG